VGLHLADPLARESRGRDDEDALGEAADLQLAQDEPRLDGLAEADLVGEQVAHAIADMARCRRGAGAAAG
jgi:hypothetical protein